MDVTEIVKTIITLLIGGLLIPGMQAAATWLTGRERRKRDDVERLEAKNDQLWARMRRRSDYAEELRAHISRGDPPPPPDYPKDY